MGSREEKLARWNEHREKEKRLAHTRWPRTSEEKKEQIFEMLKNGFSIKQICKELHVCNNTVSMIFMHSRKEGLL